MKKALIAILLLIAFGSIPLSAQFSVPIKWQSCEEDANYNFVRGGPSFSSNGKYIYSIRDSIKKLDAETLELKNVYKIQNYGGDINGSSILFSGDDNWMIGCSLDTNGVFVLKLDGSNQTKIYKKGIKLEGIVVDTNNKRVFFSEHCDANYYSKIWVANYEANQAPSIFLDSVYGGQLLYDHKRNNLIFQDVVRDWKPFLGDMLIYDAMNKTLVQKKRILRDDDPNKVGFYFRSISPDQDRISLFYLNELIYNLNTNEFEKDSLETDLKKVEYSMFSFVKNDNFLLIKRKVSSDTSIYEIIHRYTKQVVFSEICVHVNFVNFSTEANTIIFYENFDSDKRKCYYGLNLENIFSGIGGDGIIFETVYPNPVNNYLQITLANAPTSFINASITDLNGNLITTFSNLTVNNNHIEMDLTSLANGNYFLTLNSTSYLKSFKIFKM